MNMNETIQNLAFNNISAGTIMTSALIVCAYKIYHLKPLSNEISLSDFVSDIYSKELEFFKGLSDQDIDNLTDFYEYNYESRMDLIKIDLCKKYMKSQRNTFVNDVTGEVLNQESINNEGLFVEPNRGNVESPSDSDDSVVNDVTEEFLNDEGLFVESNRGNVESPSVSTSGGDCSLNSSEYASSVNDDIPFPNDRIVKVYNNCSTWVEDMTKSLEIEGYCNEPLCDTPTKENLEEIISKILTETNILEGWKNCLLGLEYEDLRYVIIALLIMVSYLYKYINNKR
uniref:Orf284 n=1 Tax=Porphyra purpurea TaxID=2787 RepID=O99974_PORPU|nr:orf284 [Porphyra purpurea]AAD03101.1 orf284 [Porphyra purpurea]